MVGARTLGGGGPRRAAHGRLELTRAGAGTPAPQRRDRARPPGRLHPRPRADRRRHRGRRARGAPDARRAVARRGWLPGLLPAGRGGPRGDRVRARHAARRRAGRSGAAVGPVVDRRVDGALPGGARRPVGIAARRGPARPADRNGAPLGGARRAGRLHDAGAEGRLTARLVPWDVDGTLVESARIARDALFAAVAAVTVAPPS